MILWARPPLGRDPCLVLWVSGVIPPQLVLERLVSVEQHRLELVRAVQLVAGHQERAPDQLNWEPSY